MKSKRFLTLGLAFLLMFISTGCSSSQKENYILEDHSGFIYNGEKCVPIDLEELNIRPTGSAFLAATSIGEITLQSWWKALVAFECGSRPQKFNMEIPLFCAGGCLDEYYCFESQYDECIEYLQGLSWTDTLGYAVYYPQDIDIVYSDELTAVILETIQNEPSNGIEFPYRSNSCRMSTVYRYDTTGMFMKAVGEIVYMENGDLYVFPARNFTIRYKDDLSPEEYDQFFVWAETYKIPSEFAAEIWQS